MSPLPSQSRASAMINTVATAVDKHAQGPKSPSRVVVNTMIVVALFIFISAFGLILCLGYRRFSGSFLRIYELVTVPLSTHNAPNIVAPLAPIESILPPPQYAVVVAEAHALGNGDDDLAPLPEYPPPAYLSSANTTFTTIGGSTQSMRHGVT